MIPRMDDPEGPGTDGTYDSPSTVIMLGIIAPLLAIVGAAVVAWNGGITLQHEDAVVHYRGFHAVASVTSVCLGVALLLVSKFLLPNWFRKSYHYQYFAIAGGVMVVIGLLWFVISSLLK